MLRIPPKVVSVLCVLQVLAIVLGYTLTRSNYKIVERLSANEPWFATMLSSRIAWYTKLMLATGPWLLILPLIWGVFATLTADAEGGIAEVSQRQACVGYILSGCVALFCVSSALQMLSAVWSPFR